MRFHPILHRVGVRAVLIKTVRSAFAKNLSIEFLLKTVQFSRYMLALAFRARAFLSHYYLLLLPLCVKRERARLFPSLPCVRDLWYVPSVQYRTFRRRSFPRIYTFQHPRDILSHESTGPLPYHSPCSKTFPFPAAVSKVMS